MTAKYLDASVVERAYRESLARLELQVLQARINCTAANAGLASVEEEFADLETEFLKWQRAQPQGEGG